MCFRFWISDSDFGRFWILYFRFQVQISDFGFQIQILDFRLQNSDFDFSGFKIFNFRFLISYFRFLILGFRGISDSGFLISVDLRFQIQISCFGRFWILDFRFQWISDFGF